MSKEKLQALRDSLDVSSDPSELSERFEDLHITDADIREFMEGERQKVEF
jgi:hypothetical protein